MKVTPLDLQFLDFIWTAAQKTAQIEPEQAMTIDAISSMYCSYTRKDKKAQKYLQTIFANKNALENILSYKISNKPENVVQVVQPLAVATFAMNNGEEKEKSDTPPAKAKDLRAQLLQLLQEAKKANPDDAEYIAKETPAILASVTRMEKRMDDMSTVLAEMIETKVQEQGVSKDEYRKLKKEIKNIAVNEAQNKDLQKLIDLQIKGLSLADVSISDIPRWLKLHLCSAIKMTAMNVVLLPFRLLFTLINQGIVQPLIEFNSWWIKKLRFVWGGVLTVVVVGTVIYVFRRYQIWDIAKENPYAQSYIQYSLSLSNQTYELLRNNFPVDDIRNETEHVITQVATWGANRFVNGLSHLAGLLIRSPWQIIRALAPF